MSTRPAPLVVPGPDGTDPLELAPIGYDVGADPVSRHKEIAQWFRGWTTQIEGGEATLRLLHPDGFPRPDLWIGQMTAGADRLTIDGYDFWLDAAMVRGEGAGDPVVVRSRVKNAENPDSWLEPHRVDTPEEVIEGARTRVRAQLQRLAAHVLTLEEEQDERLWAEAFAWTFAQMRRAGDRYADMAGGLAASESAFEAREEVERFFWDPECTTWTKREVLSIANHPRQEVRKIASLIVNGPEIRSPQAQAAIDELKRKEAERRAARDSAAAAAPEPSPSAAAPRR